MLTNVKRLTNAKMKIFVARIQIVSIPTDPIIAFAMMVMKDLFYLSWTSYYTIIHGLSNSCFQPIRQFYRRL